MASGPVYPGYVCSWLCLTVPAHNTLPAPPAVHIQLTTSQMATSDDIVKIAVGVAAGELSLSSNEGGLLFCCVGGLLTGGGRLRSGVVAGCAQGPA